MRILCITGMADLSSRGLCWRVNVRDVNARLLLSSVRGESEFTYSSTSSEARPPIRWHGIKSMFSHKHLYSGTHDEIKKVFRRLQRCLTTGRYHRLAELNRRQFSGWSFINDADLPAVDRINSVDNAHVGDPGANEIHDSVSMFCVKKAVTTLIIELP